MKVFIHVSEGSRTQKTVIGEELQADWQMITHVIQMFSQTGIVKITVAIGRIDRLVETVGVVVVPYGIIAVFDVGQ